MKSNFKVSLRKLFNLFLGTFFLALPPLIVWFSLENVRNQIFSEKASSIEKRLARDSQAMDHIINPFFEILRNVNIRFSALKEKALSVNGYDIGANLVNDIEQIAGKIYQQYGFPCEISGIVVLGQKQTELNFKNDKPTNSTRLSNLTRLMFDLRHKNFSEEDEKFYLERMRIEAKKQFSGYLDNQFLKSRGDKATSIFIRSGKSNLALISPRNLVDYQINFLIDFSQFNERFSQAMKTRNWLDDNIGLAFVSAENSVDSTIFASKRLRQKPQELKIAINEMRKIPEKAATFKIGNELFISSPISPQKSFRMLVSTGLPEIAHERELQLLLAILCIFSVFLWKVFAEAILMNRMPEISINFFVLAIFGVVNLLPLVSSVYLANEFLVANFKLEKNETSSKLREKVTSLDLQTLDNFRKTLNSLKQLDSIEKLRAFTGLKTEENIEILVMTTLQALRKILGETLVSETWIYEKSGKLVCYEWVEKYKKYSRAKKVNPILSDLMTPRFADYLKNHAQSKGKEEEFKIDKLKLEIIDELFLNMFGQKTYFNLKENFGTLLNLVTFYDKNYIISWPISKKGKPEYIFTHLIDSLAVRRHFPRNKLTESSDFTAFVLYGSATFFQTWPDSIAATEKMHPEMLRLAQDSHLSKFRFESQNLEASGSPIIVAQPAEFSDYIIVARHETRNLESFRQELVSQVVKATLLLFACMVFFAFFTSRYFLIPINDLTLATREIINENFRFRLDENHPDEFADMACTFNQMARGLEEGKLLSSFVSASIDSQLEQQNHEEQTMASRKKVSILFSGIFGFKHKHSKEAPESLFEIMQSHLEVASTTCQQFQGEIDKMIEDKVMMVFEEEQDQTSSASRAINAGEKMQKEFFIKTGQRLSIGVNTGIVVSGIMGSDAVRLSKTVVGDPVNLAARLAAIAENQNNGGIVLSGETLKHLETKISVEKLEVSSVKGKTQTVDIFLFNPAS